ncbi:hypothetical protein SCLCIDRAFT_1149467, partial [Scleroderma citrinum Foug A]
MSCQMQTPSCTTMLQSIETLLQGGSLCHHTSFSSQTMCTTTSSAYITDAPHVTEKLPVGNQKTIVSPSNHSSSSPSPIQAKKRSKLASQVPAAEFIIEMFRNARTLFNPNASCFTKYTKLQFTNHGRLSGIKTLYYYLEQNRVVAIPSGERNFHIFYYLVTGTSPEERQHLHLQEKSAIQIPQP